MQEQKRTFKYGDVFHVAGLDWIVLRTTPAPTASSWITSSLNAPA